MSIGVGFSHMSAQLSLHVDLLSVVTETASIPGKR